MTHRSARMLALGVALATAVVTACHDDNAGSCKVDTDCPTSYICRENVCGPTQQGTNVATTTDSGPGTACTSENASCNVDTDCCAGTCTNNVCTATIVQPTCTGLSALCQSPDECCTGLSCVKGVCQ